MLANICLSADPAGTEKHYNNSYVPVLHMNVSPVFTLLLALAWSPPAPEKKISLAAKCSTIFTS